jgi:hypothetical protein
MGVSPKHNPRFVSEFFAEFLSLLHLLLNEILLHKIARPDGTPQLQPYWAAGYSFSRGHFVVNVPYDFYQPVSF